jgi:hypothetical protein
LGKDGFILAAAEHEKNVMIGICRFMAPALRDMESLTDQIADRRISSQSAKHILNAKLSP